MSSLDLGIVTDLHYNLEGVAKYNVGLNEWRIFFTSGRRQLQVIADFNRYNVDRAINLGDVSDTGDSNFAASVAAHNMNITNNLTAASGKIDHIAGNHDYDNYGSIAAFGTALTSVNAARSNPWPTAKGKAVYTADVNGFRLIFLAWCIVSGGTDFDDQAHGSDPGNDQLTWLTDVALDCTNDTGLSAGAPIIIFAHAHLTTAFGGVYAYNNNAAMVATIQAVLEAKVAADGNFITVISGHVHKTLKPVIGSLYDEVNGIRYYGLGGSADGRGPRDNTSNKYYIIRFTTTGIERILEFDSGGLGRPRSSFNRIPQPFDRARGRRIFI